MPLNIQTAQVVSPVLTRIGQGFEAQNCISPLIFPVVPVGSRTGIIIEFSDEVFLEFQTTRAPGAERTMYESEYGSKNFNIRQDAWDGVVPIEHEQEAQKSLGLSLEANSALSTTQILKLAIERKAAKMLTTEENYSAGNVITVTGDSKFDNLTATPAQMVIDQQKTLRQRIGVDGNTFVITNDARDKLIRHPDVVKFVLQTKGLNDLPHDNYVTSNMLAAYFNIPRFGVATAMTGRVGSLKNVFGNNAFLCYSNPAPVASRGSPSFGYTYQLEGYPQFEVPYYKKSRSSFIIPGTEEAEPVIAGKGAGIWFKDVLTSI